MSPQSNREPIEPPGGFEPRPRPADPTFHEARPDWLTGADDGEDFPGDRSGPPLTLSRPGGGLPRPSGRPEPAGESAPPKFRLEVPEEPSAAPEEPQGGAWAAAASSIPKLTVASRERRTHREEPEEDEDLATLDRLEGAEVDTQLPDDGEVQPEAPPPLPHEPWWLVAVETLATNRPIQLCIVAVIVVVAAWIFWPRKENQTTAIAAIKHHPERFEGQPVRIRGEVGEVFDVGSGVVFLLHQRRDTLVVFSPHRRPTPRDRLILQGTVSTGYLDGTPRVALFESPAAAPTR